VQPGQVTHGGGQRRELKCSETLVPAGFQTDRQFAETLPLARGAAACLHKPVDAPMLPDVIAAALSAQ